MIAGDGSAEPADGRSGRFRVGDMRAGGAAIPTGDSTRQEAGLVVSSTKLFS